MGVVQNERRLVATNSRWKVYFDHLSDERGNEVKDYLVIEGHNPRPDGLTGVDVLPVIGDRILLLRVYRHPLRRSLWEVPRGFIDERETPAKAALRELEEETGLQCAASDLIAMGTYAPEPSTMAGRGALFVASRCEGNPRRPSDELGIDTFGLFGRQDIEAMIDAGEIVQGGALILYYRYCAFNR